MTRTHAVGSVLRLAGFITFIAATLPVFRGAEMNVTLFGIAVALFMIGIFGGVKARRDAKPGRNATDLSER